MGQTQGISVQARPNMRTRAVRSGHKHETSDQVKHVAQGQVRDTENEDRTRMKINYATQVDLITWNVK